MIKSNNVVAMLLAGGQGSRLKLLTQELAKPAVCFGGKYRIIDFTLSNATNSGIDNIGILTQYKPFELNAHIGIGECWDFDRITGGLRILPPFMREAKGDWYTGTANAIYQNIEYIDNLDAKYVLVLSADHIYKMDYRKLLKYHIEMDAD
ncbi:MAG: NTP transferase domain-containing protein, partial [Clostridiales bacterium]|nr:NTP transferase domain-containing protein [Clostridiales bacterium]